MNKITKIFSCVLILGKFYGKNDLATERLFTNLDLDKNHPTDSRIIPYYRRKSASKAPRSI